MTINWEEEHLRTLTHQRGECNCRYRTVETLPELMARLDWLYERFSETDTDALVEHIRDDWPRISKSVTELRAEVLAMHRDHQCCANDLLARIDKDEL